MHRSVRIAPSFAPSLVLAAVAAAVCACQCPGAAPASVTAAGSIIPADPGHYAEREHDGRIYVFADKKTEAAFETSPHMQLSKTFVGGGPGGMSVVFEAKDKAPEMTKRIIGEFNARHGTSLE
jgi:hypothetical protein